MRRWVTEADGNTISRIGVLTLACTLAALSLAGCQSSEPMSVDPANAMCP